jgi:hypothetical protein
MTWPYPGDSPIVVARRVAWAYRQRLERADPADCADLDRIMGKLGQHWAIPRPIVTDPAAWISAHDAAELAAVSLATLRNLRRSGRLQGRRRSARQWDYLVADILALATDTRKRRGSTP